MNVKGIAKDVSSMGGVKLGDTMDAVGTKKQPEASLNIKQTWDLGIPPTRKQSGKVPTLLCKG